MADEPQHQVDLSKLVEKLNELQSKADGDLARVLELLLLENHVLETGQSTGFRRGIGWDFSSVPRFLKFDDDSEGE